MSNRDNKGRFIEGHSSPNKGNRLYDVNDFIKEYEKCGSLKKTAENMNVSTKTISSYFKENGYNYKKRGHRKGFRKHSHQKIEYFYNVHGSLKKVSEIMGTDSHVVAKYLHELGIDTSSDAHNKGERQYDKDEIVRLYVDEELNAKEVAKKIGCSAKTVRRYLKQSGVKVRGGRYGKKMPEDVVRRSAESFKKNYKKEDHPFYLGDKLNRECPICGDTFRLRAQKSKKRTCGRKECTSEQMKKSHWNWQGGKTDSPYDDLWTERLRETVRRRDGNVCSECGANREDNSNRELAVHHIDRDKMNCSMDNLITLCQSCHMKEHTKQRSEDGRFSCLGV